MLLTFNFPLCQQCTVSTGRFDRGIIRTQVDRGLYQGLSIELLREENTKKLNSF